MPPSSTVRAPPSAAWLPVKVDPVTASVLPSADRLTHTAPPWPWHWLAVKRLVSISTVPPRPWTRTAPTAGAGSVALEVAVGDGHGDGVLPRADGDRPTAGAGRAILHEAGALDVDDDIGDGLDGQTAAAGAGLAAGDHAVPHGQVALDHPHRTAALAEPGVYIGLAVGQRQPDQAEIAAARDHHPACPFAAQHDVLGVTGEAVDRQGDPDRQGLVVAAGADGDVALGLGRLDGLLDGRGGDDVERVGGTRERPPPRRDRRGAPGRDRYRPGRSRRCPRGPCRPTDHHRCRR